MISLKTYSNARRRTPVRRDDGGQAVFVAIAILMLLSIVPVMLLKQSTAILDQGDATVNHHAAISAVNAGLNDYLDLLANNPNYDLYNASNEPSTANPAFTKWTPVPGPTLNPPEWFRYTPDTSGADSTGIVQLTVSGKAGSNNQAAISSTRFDVRKSSYLDYVYFTNYEIGDPATQSNSQYTNYCVYYLNQANPYTNGTGPDTSSFNNGGTCTFIEFSSADTLNGPVHSNDGFRICGSPTFASTASSSVYPTGTSTQRWVSETGQQCSGSPNWSVSGSPVYVPQITMPSSDTSLASEATSPATGCLYTGPTTVHFHNNGTMDVTSPLSKSTNGCGTGSGLAQPANGVIYDQNVPASASDPNYSSTATCSAQANAYTGVTGCNGDLIIGDAQAANGGVKGQLTAAAQNNVIIDGNLQYASGLTGTDVLGLVAGNYVEVNHPVTSSGNSIVNNATCTEGAAPSGSQAAAQTAPACDLDNPVIDAAILSVDHSFLVNNYTKGAILGTLNVNGSIAQDYRGAVGTVGNSGYGKDYSYDSRLQYLSPPYFPEPTSNNFEVVSFTELRPQYTS